jgi:hypothetical protein
MGDGYLGEVRHLLSIIGRTQPSRKQFLLSAAGPRVLGSRRRMFEHGGYLPCFGVIAGGQSA